MDDDYDYDDDETMMDEIDQVALQQECTELITCDAAGCTNSNPIHPCSHCQCVYYCCVECQKQEYENHKDDCPDIQEMRGQVAALTNGLVTAVEPDQDTVQRILCCHPTCGICLEEDMVNPIVLRQCEHAFCLGCLNQWNEHQSSTDMCGATTLPLEQQQQQQVHSTCPLCRHPSLPVVDAMFQNAISHLRAASLPTADKFERNMRCAAAEAELIKMFSDENNNNSNKCNNLTDKQQVQLEMIWGEIVLLQGHNNVALCLFEKMAARLRVMVQRGERVQLLQETLEQLQWDPDNQGLCQGIINEQKGLLSQGTCAEPTDHAAVLLRIGHVQRLQKNWEAALQTYQYIWSYYLEESSLPPFQQQEVFASIAEATYHLGRYDRAIAFGEASVKMNRFHAWSHKYVSLSYLALGNAAKAREIAAHAVMYETPWDDLHRARVRRWYHETFGSGNENGMRKSGIVMRETQEL